MQTDWISLGVDLPCEGLAANQNFLILLCDG